MRERAPGNADHNADMPLAAAVLGGAGLIPFVMLTGAALSGLILSAPLALFALASYGTIILSFMGGVHWGVATARSEVAGQHARFLVSVLPALAAWACLLLPDPLRLHGLAAGFLGLLAYDLASVRTGVLPRWWARLRSVLTAIVVPNLLLAALFARAP